MLPFAMSEEHRMLKDAGVKLVKGVARDTAHTMDEKGGNVRQQDHGYL